MTEQDPQLAPVPFEEAQKQMQLRKEKELAEPPDIKTDADRLLDEMRQEHPEEPEYDHL